MKASLSSGRVALVVALLAAACGSSGSDETNGAADGAPDPFDAATGSGGDGGDEDDGIGEVIPPEDDPLNIATGCSGLFNAQQVVDLELTMAPSDWTALVNDGVNGTMFSASLGCGDSIPITVAVGRKARSGQTAKPSLKIDTNYYVAGQRFFDLKKLNLESGITEGGANASARSILAEYLAWRLQVLSGAVTSRTAFARVLVNGEVIGTYVNVEKVDKRFAKRRIGDGSGWLWKFSGGDDGLKTNEGTTDPGEAYFCFFQKSGCAVPSAGTLAAELPAKLDLDQALTVAAVNAIIANRDAFMLKQNNFYYYDYATGPRMYMPWDLDSMMQSGYDVFSGSVPGGVTFYKDVFYSNWEDDYDAILTSLLEGPLRLAAIEAELDLAIAVAGAALDADTLVSGSAASGASDLKSWWTSQHAAVSAQVAAH